MAATPTAQPTVIPIIFVVIFPLLFFPEFSILFPHSSTSSSSEIGSNNTVKCGSNSKKLKIKCGHYNSRIIIVIVIPLI